MKNYCFAFLKNKTIKPIIAAASINAVQMPALKIPAIAEHPAIETSRQAKNKFEQRLHNFNFL